MWWHRFVNRADAYAVQAMYGGKCQYFARYEQLTPSLFDLHLAGIATLGIPAIDAGGMSRWCCFDADKDDGSIERVEILVKQQGWHCVREGRRPGRGGHLWLFFASPIPAADLRVVGRRLIECAGIAKGSLEFFPKQDKPEYDHEKNRFKTCSIVRLPLGIHRKPDALGARGWFDGVEQSLEKQTQWIAGQPVNAIGPIQNLAAQLRQLEAARNASGRPQNAANYSPPDVTTLKRALSLISPDDYGTWTEIGMALKAGGFDVSMWEDWSARSDKYRPGDCRKKWGSFSGSRKGLGTVFYLAKQNGFAFESPQEAFGHLSTRQ